MGSDQSILQAIRKKELEMNVQIEQARSEADAILQQAQKEAEATIETYDAEGEEEGRKYYERDIEAIHKEIAAIIEERKEEERSVRKQWEKNVLKAVETVIQQVRSG